jgi:hypothetical protein
MDAGILGGIIGVATMICIVCTGGMYEKGGEILNRIKQRIQCYKQQKQPLLPVTKTNPVLLQTPSKQFQMKELLVIK